MNRNNIIAGDGIDIDYTSQGMILRSPGLDEPTVMSWAGDYDFSASYYPGQVVRVTGRIVYQDQNGMVIPFGNSDGTSSVGSPISSGSFVCVNFVPPYFMTEDFVTFNYLNQFAVGSLPNRYVLGTRAYEYNAYYPISPEPYSGSSVTILGNNNYVITRNQTFWVQLTGGGGGSGGGGTGLPVFV